MVERPWPGNRSRHTFSATVPMTVCSSTTTSSLNPSSNAAVVASSWAVEKRARDGVACVELDGVLALIDHRIEERYQLRVAAVSDSHFTDRDIQGGLPSVH